MTLLEIREALMEKVVREEARPFYHSAKANSEMTKAKQALIAAVHSIDDYYKHSHKAVGIYCEQFKK
jgi:hypothetical protein